MTGERTPDATPSSVKGSSDDDISLREHLQRQLDTMRQFVLRMDEDQGRYFERVIAELRNQLDERHHASTVALAAALTNADTSVRMALEATKEAISKADDATARRFESVNEFRGQLDDQARKLMPRSESEVRMQALSDRIDSNGQQILAIGAIQSDRITKLELDVRTTLATSKGQGVGIDKTIAWIFAAAGFVSTVVAVAFALTRS